MAANVHATSRYNQQYTAPSNNLGIWTRHPQVESGYILRRNMDWQSACTTCERRRTPPPTPNATRARNRTTTTYSRNLRRLRPHRSAFSRNRGAHTVLVTTRPASSYSRLHCMPPPHLLHLGFDRHHPHKQHQPTKTLTTNHTIQRANNPYHHHLPSRTKTLTTNLTSNDPSNHHTDYSTT